MQNTGKDPRDIKSAFQRDITGQASYKSNVESTLRKQHGEQAAKFNKPTIAQKGNFKR